MAAIATTVRSLLTSFIQYAQDQHERRNTVETHAAPGLMTLLDVALFRSNEGCLTSTVCAADAVLAAFLELKRRSSELLSLVLTSRHRIDGDVEGGGDGGRGGTRRRGGGGEIDEDAEGFARLCLDCANEAIQRIATDKLALTANLNPDPDANEDGSDGGGSGGGRGGISSSSGGRTVSSAQGSDDAVAEGVLMESSDGAWGGGGGRRSRQPRRRDCWESPRLFCPDYVWADDVASYCQKLVRGMAKHRFLSGGHPRLSILGDPSGGGGDREGGCWSALSPACSRAAEAMRGLVLEDLPGKLHQFRAAIDSDSAASKRLYLVKCEYRAPFRGFLEAHNAVQKAPRIEMVDEYLALHKRDDAEELKRRKENAERRIKKALESTALVEALKLEQQCEMVEVGLAKALLPFSELARCLDQKKIHLNEVPGVLEARDMPAMDDLLRRLRSILCRKVGSETSTGIRALLLDIQGVPRDDTLALSEALPFGTHPKETEYDATLLRLKRMLSLLQCLSDLCRTKGGFQPDVPSKKELDIPPTVLKACALLDAEMFEAQYKDWHAMVKRQRELSSGKEGSLFAELSEEMRIAEIEVSIAMAAQPALEIVRQRLDLLEKDRMKRFEVLEDMAREVCIREMDMTLVLSPPAKDAVLELPEISALGVFGLQLHIAGEPLPLG